MLLKITGDAGWGSLHGWEADIWLLYIVGDDPEHWIGREELRDG